MTYRDTVKAAVIAASKHTLTGLPAEAVRWRDEPQKQQDARFPNITISTVSHVPSGPVSMQYVAEPDGNLRREFSQVWYWTIQVKVESWRADSKTDSNPWHIVNRMRFGWKTLACQRALDDGPEDRPFQTRFPVKLVSDAGDVREVTSPVGGHMLPQYIYEVELSYVAYDVDPERDGVIEHVELHGHIGGTTDDDAVVITTDP